MAHHQVSELRTMRTLQRWLSDLLNLFLHDPEDPDRLVPWRDLMLYLLVALGLVAMIMHVF